MGVPFPKLGTGEGRGRGGAGRAGKPCQIDLFYDFDFQVAITFLSNKKINEEIWLISETGEFSIGAISTVVLKKYWTKNSGCSKNR
ncbi:hypothetical protein [Roseibium aggregatum]|uniref:hypothetical protein n=1 Tax=Roseibium aggregatum TaxID=187304 RepID=UPI001E2AC706|nr:hypothetical protein [Roseibium aggregatum]UES38640.1 hypothetical protein GFC08_12740 [Roseibium aggregatum]